MTDTATFPPLYRRWLEQALPGPLPVEDEATCDACPMCLAAGSDPAAGFLAETKCCTFTPSLPCFLVGGLLGDLDEALAPGRERVAARVRHGAGATPLGLEKPATYQLIWRHAQQAYGRSRALVCPYYRAEQGSCAIWPHREATCATWFCRHRRGAVGQRFWRDAQRLLCLVEESLGLWCALELGLDQGALRALLPRRAAGATLALGPAEVDDEPDAGRLAELWGRWRNQQERYYAECARLVGQLAWQDLPGIAGAPLRALARVLEASHEAVMTPTLPDRLAVGTWQIVGGGEGTVWVVGYSEYDPLELPCEVLELLRYCDGRSPDEVTRAVRAEAGLELEEGLLQQLVDFGLIRPAGRE